MTDSIHRLPVGGNAVDPGDLECTSPDACARLCACQADCHVRSFLYPRGLRDNGNKHFHQGIDLGAPHANLLSVVDGYVYDLQRSPENTRYGGYGMTIVIKAADEELYFLYGHCGEIAPGLHKGDGQQPGTPVSEGQVIGKVGNTAWSKSNPSATTTYHLHFEASSTPYPKPATVAEAILGQELQPAQRLDPLAVLEELGPWGGARPPLLPNGEMITPDVAIVLHERVERARRGGYFPIGANRIWHGGVHLTAAAGRELVLPIHGTLVAARLDEDPQTAFRELGGTNFVLVRHVLDQDTADRLRGTQAPQQAAPSRIVRLVGDPHESDDPNARYVWNDPAMVEYVGRMLRATRSRNGTPYLADSSESPIAGSELFEAITLFQVEELHRRRPDGVVQEGARTWRRLERLNPSLRHLRPTPPTPPSSTPPRPDRIVYSLFSNLPALPLEEASSYAHWLTRAYADAESRAREEAERAAAMQGEREEAMSLRFDFEVVEAPAVPTPSRTAAGASTVGATRSEMDSQAIGSNLRRVRRRPDFAGVGPGLPNTPRDVAWVRMRLRRFRRKNDGQPYLPASSEVAAGPTSESSDISTVSRPIVNSEGRFDTAFATEPAADQALFDAIRAFQQDRVPRYRRGGSGRIPNARSDTLAALSRPPYQVEGGEISPSWLAKVRERLPDRADGTKSTTKVVTGMEVEIAGGEVIWKWNPSSSVDARANAFVHWEMFGSDPLVPSTWIQQSDDDPDLTIDDARWSALLDSIGATGSIPPSASSDEVDRFYAEHASVPRLRRTAIKFASEWGQSADVLASALERSGVRVPDEVRPSLADAMWWDATAASPGVLPASKLVWHYNPIEFLNLYAEATQRYVGRVEVTLLGAPHNQPVVLSAHRPDGTSVLDASTTTGRVNFRRLPHGPYIIKAADGSRVHVTVRIAETTRVTLRLGNR